MAVPRIIEFIESLQRPLNSSFVSEHGGGQVIVPMFPPATSAVIAITPPEGYYALITYRVSFGINIVPNVFTGWFEHAGRLRYSGTLTETVIHDGLDWYLVITDTHPLRASITNVSGLIQHFEEIHQFAIVYSAEDYNIIVNALENLANKNQDTRQTEANRLLGLMTGTPRPPIEEGA